jgi:two-component system nitrate/nitrite response regulator NarL
MTESTRVLIIDDHPLFRRGVRQLLELESGYDVVGEAAGGQQGIDLARLHDPDLILLDLNMTGMGGLETLRTMRDLGVGARIIVLTVSNSPDDLIAAIRAGSDGFILKDNDPEDILQMIAGHWTARTPSAPNSPACWPMRCGKRPPWSGVEAPASPSARTPFCGVWPMACPTN